MTTRARLLIALVGVTALFAAACSSDDTASTDPGDEPTTEKVVTIGVIAPLDAGLTAYGRGIANSVQLAADEANAAGAIPGYTIEVEALNDSSDPEVGRAAAEQLAADDTVVGVVGTYNSGVAAEVAPVLGEAGIVMVSPGNTNPALTVGDDPANPQRQNDNYFRVVATDADQGDVLAAYATEDLGLTNAAVVSEDKPVSLGLVTDFEAAFTAAGGTIDSSATVAPEPTDADLAAAAEAVVATGAPLALFGGEYDVASRYRTALDAAGFTGILMGSDGIKDDAYVAEVGADIAAGDVASSVGVPNANLDAPEYFAAYEAAGFIDPPSDFGPYAFDAANLIIAAAAEALAGTTDGVTPEVRAEVRDLVQDTVFEGITGPVAFNEFGDTVTRVFTVYAVEGEGWVPVVTRQSSS